MELKGDGFMLRGWLLTDAGSLQRNADNNNISRNLMDRFPSPYTMSDAEAWVYRWENQVPVVNFAIVIDKEIAGGIGLEFRQDVYRKTPLLGYWLAQQYWGKGIMPQAVKLITSYAFNSLDVICVVANVFSGNTSSMRVLEKAGFKQQGVIRQSVIKDGVILDEYVYAINNLSFPEQSSLSVVTKYISKKL